MDQGRCNDFLNVASLLQAFRQNIQEQCNRIFRCLDLCYKSVFVKWAQVYYRGYPKETMEQWATDAFQDGVLKMTETAAGRGLYEGNAQFQTLVFSFCRNMLMARIKTEQRRLEKEKAIVAGLIKNGEPIIDPDTHQPLVDAMEWAMQKIEPADREIISLKFLEGRSNEELGSLLDIDVKSATNRLYRCMVRLRKYAEEKLANDGYFRKPV